MADKWCIHENATLEIHPVDDEHGIMIIAEIPADAKGDNEVNARLIAAAPDMRAMLQEISEWLTCPDCTPATVEHIKARIDALLEV